jgi:hypothetical protein
MSEILDKIKSRGHWRIAIRPVSFNEARVPYEELSNIIEQRQVQFRGWYVPHISHDIPMMRGADWVGQESAHWYHLESWRFFTSGQFALVRAFPDDWRYENDPDAPESWVPGARVQVATLLFLFTEIFEFAARLAMSPAGDNEMQIRIVTSGLLDRNIVVDDFHRAELSEAYRASMDEYPYEITVARDELVTEARNLAVQASRELFMRFGWTTVRPELLAEYQQELVRGPLI